MERFRLIFPSLAHMERIEVAMLPFAIVFLIGPISVLIHNVYVSLGWVVAVAP